MQQTCSALCFAPSAPPCYGSCWVDGESGSQSSVEVVREGRKHTPPAQRKISTNYSTKTFYYNPPVFIACLTGKLSGSSQLSLQCTGDSVVLWTSPQSETCSWLTAESGAAHPEGSPPSSPLPPEQKTPGRREGEGSRETLSQQQRGKCAA